MNRLHYKVGRYGVDKRKYIKVNTNYLADASGNTTTERIYDFILEVMIAEPLFKNELSYFEKIGKNDMCELFSLWYNEKDNSTMFLMIPEKNVPSVANKLISERIIKSTLNTTNES